MARPRAAALQVDAGPPPEPPDEAQLNARPAADGDPGPGPGVVELAGEKLVEWETAVVGDLLVIPFVPMHYIARRGGAPPGIFIPDELERDNMARPLTRMLNRSERLRRLAPIGDPLAFLLAVSTFVREEAAELERWRDSHATHETEANLEPPIFGVGVRPTERPSADANGAAREPQPAGFRSWRSPTLPGEEPIS